MNGDSNGNNLFQVDALMAVFSLKNVFAISTTRCRPSNASNTINTADISASFKQSSQELMVRPYRSPHSCFSFGTRQRNISMFLSTHIGRYEK
jgi:hypothetical protein